jgi:hypothetical protein
MIHPALIDLIECSTLCGPGYRAPRNRGQNPDEPTAAEAADAVRRDMEQRRAAMREEHRESQAGETMEVVLACVRDHGPLTGAEVATRMERRQVQRTATREALGRLVVAKRVTMKSVKVAGLGNTLLYEVAL